MTLALAKASQTTTASRRLRVMIVDDAVVVRGLFARWVEAEPDLQVAATLRSGREAVEQIERCDPDVVVLDVEMPDLDGLSALPLLFQKKRDLVVIMASTLTRRNAEISLRALSLGAADYVAKPQTSEGPVSASSSFRRELIEKIRQLGERARRKRLAARLPQAGRAGRLPLVGAAPPLVPRAPHYALRPFPRTLPRVLAIGASTGGPQALTGLMRKLGSLIDRAPVIITQHMPPTFTTILAEHMARVSGRPAREAQHGEEINAGTIYLAPGGKHMKVARRDGVAVIEIDDGPQVNFCKPAVDPMFSSAAAVWGQWVLGLVLTGMGADGLRGARTIADAGGAVITQDEPSSVVWGMPGQVTQAGISSAVLPLDQIAGMLLRLFGGERP
jgi:two-component system, chemotaxis family, protein-glutamate methylesterase/glutaminase